ncbi:hypothetical protein JOB18_033609 [Solea senegalensis]|nr:hypothetical protein JOB18_033609 [Solea senegalensis]
MTIVQLGVIVFAICLSTQVLCQNNTTPMSGNYTSSPMNVTVTSDANSTWSNTTDPTGAGVSLHAGAFPFLIPVITSATLLLRNC